MSTKLELPHGLKIDNKVYKYVTVRGITGREQDYLVDADLVKNNKHIGKILQSCVLSIETKDGDVLPNPSRHVDSMLSTDRLFLIVRIRQESLDNNFVFEYTCSNQYCKHVDKLKLDLSTLECTNTPEDQVTMEYEVTLPSGKEAKLKCLNGADEYAIFDILRNKTKEYATSTLELAIKEIDGQPAKKDQIKDLPLRDINFIRAYVDSKASGLDNWIQFSCSKCGKEYKELLPVHDGVFFSHSQIEDSSSET